MDRSLSLKELEFDSISSATVLVGVWAEGRAIMGTSVYLALDVPGFGSVESQTLFVVDLVPFH